VFHIVDVRDLFQYVNTGLYMNPILSMVIALNLPDVKRVKIHSANPDCCYV